MPAGEVMSMSDGRSRRAQRAGLTDKQRINFLEDDQDRSDAKLSAAIEGIAVDIRDVKSLFTKVLISTVLLSFTILGGIVTTLVTR
jgi:hypothetical protein